jgi:hypothetical protein
MLFICSLSFSFGANFTGGIDVYPQYIAGDSTTPFAIHFYASGLNTNSGYTVKIRIGNTATGGAWGHTWGGAAGWLNDGSPFAAFTTAECNLTTDASGNGSKWVFARCTAVASIVTTNIRLRYSSSNIDATALAYQSAMNMSTNGGWIAGTLSNSSNVVVLAKDAGGNILGTGITEDNGITEGNASTDGYFKVAVPVGTVTQLEFRNLDNTPHGYTQSGTWNITANTVTDAGSISSLVPVELSSFSIE